MFHQDQLTISTRGRGTIEITGQVEKVVQQSGIEGGLASVFLHHTSASLILCENADPGVRRDLDRYFDRLVPDGDPLFEHTLEGEDDMPAHIRSILTTNSLTIPVSGKRLDLGTWQGVFLYEHRTSPHRRRVTVSVLG